MARQETEIVHACMKQASLCGARVFKNVRGMFYALTIVQTLIDAVKNGGVMGFYRAIKTLARIQAGLLCDGASDLIGWTKNGKFLAMEVKTATGRPSPEQLNFIEQVKKSGGIAGVVRCPEDVIRLLGE